jgi:hypothetical protein
VLHAGHNDIFEVGGQELLDEIRRWMEGLGG